MKPVGLMRQEETGDTIQEYREVFTRVLDEKVYELKDHLGNVRVVISDVKLNGGAPGAESGQRPYMADLRSYNNYYAFGMLQPDRSWSAGGIGMGLMGRRWIMTGMIRMGWRRGWGIVMTMGSGSIIRRLRSF